MVHCCLCTGYIEVNGRRHSLIRQALSSLTRCAHAWQRHSCNENLCSIGMNFMGRTFKYGCASPRCLFNTGSSSSASTVHYFCSCEKCMKNKSSPTMRGSTCTVFSFYFSFKCQIYLSFRCMVLVYMIVVC